MGTILETIFLLICLVGLAGIGRFLGLIGIKVGHDDAFPKTDRMLWVARAAIAVEYFSFALCFVGVLAILAKLIHLISPSLMYSVLIDGEMSFLVMLLVPLPAWNALALAANDHYKEALQSLTADLDELLAK